MLNIKLEHFDLRYHHCLLYGLLLMVGGLSLLSLVADISAASPPSYQVTDTREDLIVSSSDVAISDEGELIAITTYNMVNGQEGKLHLLDGNGQLRYTAELEIPEFATAYFKIGFFDDGGKLLVINTQDPGGDTVALVFAIDSATPLYRKELDFQVLDFEMAAAGGLALVMEEPTSGETYLHYYENPLDLQAPSWSYNYNNSDENFSYGFNAVRISKDGSTVVVSSRYHELFYFSATNGTLLWRTEAPRERLSALFLISELRLSADGARVLQSKEELILCYGADSSTPLWSYNSSANGLSSLVMDQEAALVVAQAMVTGPERSQHLLFLDGATGQLVHKMELERMVSSLNVDRTGKRLSLTAGTYTRLYDITNLTAGVVNELWEFKLPDVSLLSLTASTMSADGGTTVASSTDPMNGGQYHILGPEYTGPSTSDRSEEGSNGWGLGLLGLVLVGIAAVFEYRKR